MMGFVKIGSRGQEHHLCMVITDSTNERFRSNLGGGLVMPSHLVAVEDGDVIFNHAAMCHSLSQ
jgi:hypothetical protein